MNVTGPAALATVAAIATCSSNISTDCEEATTNTGKPKTKNFEKNVLETYNLTHDNSNWYKLKFDDTNWAKNLNNFKPMVNINRLNK